MLLNDMKKTKIKVPFNMELADKLKKQEIDWRIVTANGAEVKHVFVNKNHDCVGYSVNGVFVPYFLTENKDCVNLTELYIEVEEDAASSRIETYSSEDGAFQSVYIGGELRAIVVGTEILIGEVLSAPIFKFWKEGAGRPASQDEKVNVVEVLQKSNRSEAKEILYEMMKTDVYLVNHADIMQKGYLFKTGDPVLGMDGSGYWRYDIFSHFDNKDKGLYVCTGRSYTQCIPYKGHEDWVGTTKNVEE